MLEQIKEELYAWAYFDWHFLSSIYIPVMVSVI